MWWAQGLKPLPITKDCSPQKMADLMFFSHLNFHKLGPISKALYLHQRWLIYNILQAWLDGPYSKDFLTKNVTFV